MPIRGAEYALDRIVAILQANLSAELDLVESISGLDPIPNGLDEIPSGNYFKHLNPAALIALPLAIVVHAIGTDPIQIDSIANTPGRYVAEHFVTVEIHVKDTPNEEPNVTQARVLRYAIAIERVLAIKNVTLGATVTRIRRDGRATYGAERGGEDEAGQFTRTATIPFAVQEHANL